MLGWPSPHHRLKSVVAFISLLSLILLGLAYQKELRVNTNVQMFGTASFISPLKNITDEMELLRQATEKNEWRQLNATFEEYQQLFRVSNVSCTNIFAGAKFDIKNGIDLAKAMKKEVQLLSNEFFINETKNCSTYIRTRGYIMSHLTEAERHFPIAYSMLVYKDVEMVDRLLRAIYRPQNWYCLHVDAKSNKDFYKAIDAISQCFPNVFLAPRQISVVWGEFSVLEPELLCMKELWSRGKKWKYFINLTGQEFPLKTNAELVQILTAYDGANDIEGTIQRANKERWMNTSPPKGIRPLKGSVHICVNRRFVEYILHNETASVLLDWVKTTQIPDETFFATLNHNPQLAVPGSYKGWPETDSTNRKPFLTRYKNWGSFPCAGYWTRGICILSTGDLPLLGQRRELFANKFHLYNDRVVIGCLEEKHFNDTRDEYLGLKSFNVSFYQQLGFVQNKIQVWSQSATDRNNSLVRLSFI